MTNIYFEAMFFDHISSHIILFFILYGMTGVVPLIASFYLLFRRGNAFASDVIPPVRLRRWAASFFGVSALGHVWWLLFYIHSSGIHSLNERIYSAAYIMIVMLDCATLMVTIAGTLLAMLQDRERRVWPVIMAMIPFAALGTWLIISPSGSLFYIFVTYVLLLYVSFTIYVVFAVRQYGRWLRDNFADLERKEVWLTHVLSLVFMLLFTLYALVDSNTTLIYILHFVELTLFFLLLWRVETLSGITPDSSLIGGENEYTNDSHTTEETSIPLSHQGWVKSETVFRREAPNVEQLLAERCVAMQLYLQHDLTLQQLAMTLGTNRSYLSQYFSRQNITYNTYINNLRINHFIKRYQEVVSTSQPFTVQQLASESGYRSYSTFSLAFKQRMGQNVTAWMREESERAGKTAT